MINIATCGIIPLYEGFKDTCETGSDEAMQAIGGAAVGLVPVTRVVGPLVRRVARPVAPGGRIPLPMVPKPPRVLPPVAGFDYIDPATLNETLIIEELFSNPIPDPRQFSKTNRRYNDGRFELMNGLQHKTIFGTASTIAHATETIADEWCMMSYRHRGTVITSISTKLRDFTLDYHFAFNPSRNMVVPHYIKKVSP